VQSWTTGNRAGGTIHGREASLYFYPLISSSCFSRPQMSVSVSVTIETMSKPCCNRILAFCPLVPIFSIFHKTQKLSHSQKMAAFLPCALDTLRTFEIADSCSSPPKGISIDFARSNGPVAQQTFAG